MEDTRLPLILSLAGTIPFLVLAACIIVGGHHEATLINMFVTYAAVIFSFLAGIHWGLAISHIEENPRIARIMIAESTIASLFAWCILFLDETYLRVLMFAFLYAFIWGIDSVLYNNKIIPLWFFNVRGVVTPIVVVSMYVVYFNII